MTLHHNPSHCELQEAAGALVQKRAKGPENSSSSSSFVIHSLKTSVLMILGTHKLLYRWDFNTVQSLHGPFAITLTLKDASNVGEVGNINWACTICQALFMTHQLYQNMASSEHSVKTDIMDGPTVQVGKLRQKKEVTCLNSYCPS